MAKKLNGEAERNPRFGRGNSGRGNGSRGNGGRGNGGRGNNEPDLVKGLKKRNPVGA